MAENIKDTPENGCDYIVLKGKWVEELTEDLKKYSKQGYRIAAYFQEHALTKILLEKEL
jgi:hypothetical protein